LTVDEARAERLVMAYADPPYLGCCRLYDHDHPDGRCWDDADTHGALIERLVRDYPDGWALSLSTPSTQIMLDHCRDHGLSLFDGDIRMGSWVKPFAAFKANVRVAYTWEPVIWKPAVRLPGAIPTRDHVACPITMKRGLTGAKPEKVCHWLFSVMGLAADR
jgi:hypothetical protein